MTLKTVLWVRLFWQLTPYFDLRLVICCCQEVDIAWVTLKAFFSFYSSQDTVILVKLGRYADAEYSSEIWCSTYAKRLGLNNNAAIGALYLSISYLTNLSLSALHPEMFFLLCSFAPFVCRWCTDYYFICLAALCNAFWLMLTAVSCKNAAADIRMPSWRKTH